MSKAALCLHRTQFANALSLQSPSIPKLRAQIRQEAERAQITYTNRCADRSIVLEAAKDSGGTSFYASLSIVCTAANDPPLILTTKGVYIYCNTKDRYDMGRDSKNVGAEISPSSEKPLSLPSLPSYSSSLSRTIIPRIVRHSSTSPPSESLLRTRSGVATRPLLPPVLPSCKRSSR